MKRICVYTGSNKGHNPVFEKNAKLLGKCLSSNKIELVYGGAGIGLMKVIADSVLDHGGDVIGIIPRFLFEKELTYNRLKDLRVVNTMHERKYMMNELSDGFIVMPGGFGTLDEFFEILTWNQLNIIQKPIGILNSGGFYNDLFKFLESVEQEGFIRKEHLNYFIMEEDPETLIGRMAEFRQPQNVNKWTNR